MPWPKELARDLPVALGQLNEATSLCQHSLTAHSPASTRRLTALGRLFARLARRNSAILAGLYTELGLDLPHEE
jgi:hypothetical protein